MRPDAGTAGNASGRYIIGGTHAVRVFGTMGTADLFGTPTTNAAGCRARGKRLGGLRHRGDTWSYRFARAAAFRRRPQAAPGSPSQPRAPRWRRRPGRGAMWPASERGGQPCPALWLHWKLSDKEDRGREAAEGAAAPAEALRPARAAPGRLPAASRPARRGCSEAARGPRIVHRGGRKLLRGLRTRAGLMTPSATVLTRLIFISMTTNS